MNDNSRIGAVVFDMDGVLSDSEPPINAAAGAMFKEWVELVRTCKDAGLKIAFASSADRIKVDANLNKIGLLPEQWDAIVTAENVVKPGPEIFLASAQKLGLPPEQCVVVVDSINGVQAAKAAGIRCVAVAQSFRPEELQAADLIKQKISEVSLSDLVASAVGSSVTVVSAPLPGQAVAAQRALWGIGATLGLGLVIALGFVLAQIAAGIAFSVVAMATGHQEIIREA